MRLPVVSVVLGVLATVWVATDGASGAPTETPAAREKVPCALRTPVPQRKIRGRQRQLPGVTTKGRVSCRRAVKYVFVIRLLGRMPSGEVRIGDEAAMELDRGRKSVWESWTVCQGVGAGFGANSASDPLPTSAWARVSLHERQTGTPTLSYKPKALKTQSSKPIAFSSLCSAREAKQR